MKDVICALGAPNNDSREWSKDTSTFSNHPEIIDTPLDNPELLGERIVVESINELMQKMSKERVDKVKIRQSMKSNASDIEKELSDALESKMDVEDILNNISKEINLPASSTTSTPSAPPTNTPISPASRPASTNLSQSHAPSSTNSPTADSPYMNLLGINNRNSISRTPPPQTPPPTQSRTPPPTQSQVPPAQNTIIKCPKCSSSLSLPPNITEFNCPVCQSHLRLAAPEFYYRCQMCNVVYKYNKLCSLKCVTCNNMLVQIPKPNGLYLV